MDGPDVAGVERTGRAADSLLRCAAALLAALLMCALSLAACTGGQADSNGEPDDAPTDPTVGPADGAEIRVKSESAHAVEYRIFDQTGDDLVFDLQWTSRAGGIWESPFYTGRFAHLHGPAELNLPTVEQLEAEARQPADALMSFDPSFRNASFDDISIVQLEGDVVAIALWQDGLVRRVHLAGTALLERLEQPTNAPPELCAVLREQCVQQHAGRHCAEVDLFPCVLATLFCDADDRAAACDQFSQWCACGTEAIGDGNRLACALLISRCEEQYESEIDESIQVLLEWIVQLLQAQLAQ